MKVALINPNPGGHGLNEATIEPPLGLGYMAAVLEQQGFDCTIVDANVLRLTNEETVQAVPAGTQLVAVSCNSFSYDAVGDICKRIRASFQRAFLIIGGPLPSAAPEMVLSEVACDGLVRGEGEYVFLQIAENIRNGEFLFSGTLPGVAYFSAAGEYTAQPPQRIRDLDSLPFPAFHLMPPLKKYKSRSRKKPVCAIITSRGCAFGCSFCSKDVFGRRVTFRSAANVLAEIDYLVNRFKVRQIDIMDDNFAQKKTRLIAILDGLIDRGYDLAINLQSGIRVEGLDENVLSKMKRAGVYKLAFGVESADPRVLDLHHKKLDLQKLESVVRLAKRLDFLVYGFFIIGLPGESDAAFHRTLDFVKKLDFDVANFCIAVPFLGTELYRMVEKDGQFLIDTRRNISSGFYDGKAFFTYQEMDKEVVEARYKLAYKSFYSVKKQIRMLAKIRSVHELVWLRDAMAFVLRGFFRKFF